MTGPELLDDDLARELRAIAPRPDPRFRARLDAGVEAGFPRPARRRRLPRPRILVPALGTALAGVLALAVVLGGARDEQAGTDGGPAAAVQRESAAPQADAGSAAAPPAATEPAAPGRRVERSARLELGAPPGRFQAVTDGVVRTTQRAGGYVATSQIGRDGEGGTAAFVLRIPSGRLDDALAQLSRLGSVRSIEGSTQDLTGRYDATSAKLDDARTQRRAIVAELATATGAEAARLRARLATATARVQRLEREQRSLRTRTTYATVDVTVVATRGGAAVPGGGPWTPGDAWRDARRGLEVAAGVVIVAASFALPLGLLAWLAAWVRRRRRDALLGG